MDAISLPAATVARTLDYANVALADRTAMQLAADRIRDRLSSIQGNLLAIGRVLLMVKVRVPHGTFGVWVEAEPQIRRRAAQNYMNVARFMQSVSEPEHETVSLLQPTALYKLAPPSTPQDVVMEIVGAAESGTLPPPPAILQRIDEAARDGHKLAKAQQGKPGCAEAERACEKNDLRGTVQRLVSDHRDAMQEIAAVLNSPVSRYFRDFLRAALAEAVG